MSLVYTRVQENEAKEARPTTRVPSLRSSARSEGGGGNREGHTGCACAAPQSFNFSRLGATAAHGDCLDSVIDQRFACLAKVQTVFQECELLERTLPALKALLAAKVSVLQKN